MTVPREVLLFAANTIHSLSGPMYALGKYDEALADERRGLEMVNQAAPPPIATTPRFA